MDTEKIIELINKCECCDTNGNKNEFDIAREIVIAAVKNEDIYRNALKELNNAIVEATADEDCKGNVFVRLLAMQSIIDNTRSQTDGN